MKREKKVLATITLTLYEGGECDLKGIDPQDFKTQEEFIKALDVLVGVCWRFCVHPTEIIPGGNLLHARQVGWKRIGGVDAQLLVAGGIELENGRRDGHG